MESMPLAEHSQFSLAGLLERRHGWDKRTLQSQQKKAVLEHFPGEAFGKGRGRGRGAAPGATLVKGRGRGRGAARGRGRGAEFMRKMPNSRKGTGTLTKTGTETLTAETRTGAETGKRNGNKNGKRRRSIAPCDHEAESCGMCHVLLPCTARRAACRNPWATDPLGAHSAPGVIHAMRPLCNNSN